jgi:anti-sigma B factor antagonist
MLTINAQKNDSTVTLRLTGRIDETTCSQLRTECTSWILRGEKTLVLDCEGVLLATSMGVHAILMTGKQLRQANGSLVLCGFHGQVRQIFEFSGLAELFQTFDTFGEWTAVQATRFEAPRYSAEPHLMFPNASASEDNSLGAWLVRAFSHPVAYLDSCASWWRRLSTMELVATKR